MYTLINTAKLNGVDPQAWLADVLARIADMPLSRLPELLPWNWAPAPRRVKSGMTVALGGGLPLSRRRACQTRRVDEARATAIFWATLLLAIRSAAEAGQSGRPTVRDQVGSRDRAADMPALQKVAADGAKQVSLLTGLDALGGDRYAEGAAERHNCRNDLASLRRFSDRGD